jgi:hypothetical protein
MYYIVDRNTHVVLHSIDADLWNNTLLRRMIVQCDLAQDFEVDYGQGFY